MTAVSPLRTGPEVGDGGGPDMAGGTSHERIAKG